MLHLSELDDIDTVYDSLYAYSRCDYSALVRQFLNNNVLRGQSLYFGKLKLIDLIRNTLLKMNLSPELAKVSLSDIEGEFYEVVTTVS